MATNLGHYIEGHNGPWQECQACKDFWSAEEYKDYTEGSLNIPEFVTKP